MGALSLFLLVAPTASAASSSSSTQTSQDRRRDLHLEQRLEQSQQREEENPTPSPTQASSEAPPGAAPAGPSGGPISTAPPESLHQAATPEEIVAGIRLRAQQELARRRARRWDLSTLVTWTVADETNPNFSKAHKSALSTEEYLSSTLSYQLAPRLTWQASYGLDAFHYNEFTDLSTVTNSLATKLVWRFAEALRLEAHYLFDDNQYPYDRRSSTWDQRVHLRLRHSFLRHFYHYAGWTYLNRQYPDQTTQDGDGNRIIGKHRKDQRQTGLYEIGDAFDGHTSLAVRQEFYFQTSNAAFQDFYDAQDYKVRLSGSHDWSKRWSTSGSFAYELKRYGRRDISDRAVAERDNITTYQVGVTYQFSPEVDVTYTWRYFHQRSNDATQKFGDVTNSLALTAAF